MKTFKKSLFYAIAILLIVTTSMSFAATEPGSGESPAVPIILNWLPGFGIGSAIQGDKETFGFLMKIDVSAYGAIIAGMIIMFIGIPFRAAGTNIFSVLGGMLMVGGWALHFLFAGLVGTPKPIWWSKGTHGAGGSDDDSSSADLKVKERNFFVFPTIAPNVTINDEFEGVFGAGMNYRF